MGNEFLLSEYADEVALAAQTKAILDSFKSIEDKAKEVALTLKGALSGIGDKNLGGKAALDGLKDLDDKTKDYIKTIKGVTPELQKISIQQKQAALDLIELKKWNVELAIVAKEKAAAEKLAAQVQKESTTASKESIKTKKEQAAADKEAAKIEKEKITYQQALEKEKAKTNSQAIAESKIAAQLTDEYALLNKALKDQELRYKNLALVHGIESEAAKDALKTALDTRSVLDKLDTNLKNNQRNVGNYKSAFDGLGMSFTQVARELPSLAINTQTFLLAISNNLPMVFDEIGKAKTEIAALKAQGEETPGLFDRISKSIFSTQVVLSILVTLLTILGPKIIEFVGGLFSAEDAERKLRKATEDLTESQEKLIKSSKELVEVYKDPIVSTDRLEKELAISNALGKSRGDILAIEKKIAAQKATTANIKFFDTGGFTKQQELSNQLLKDEIAFETELGKLNDYKAKRIQSKDYGSDKEIEKLTESVDFYEKALKRSREAAVEQKQVIKDNFDTQIEDEKKANEITAYNQQQALDIRLANIKRGAEARMNADKRVLDDERNFAEKRIAALKDESVQKIKIINAETQSITKNPNNKNADGSFTAEAINALNDAKAQRIEIAKSTEVAIFNVREEFRKRRLAAEIAITQTELNTSINASKEISGAEYVSLTKRTEAFSSYVTDQKALILAEYQYEKATKIHTGEELLALETSTNAKLLALKRQALKDLSDIRVSSINQVQVEADAINKKNLAFEELRNSKSIKDIEKRAVANKKAEYEAARGAINDRISNDNEILNSAQTTDEARYKAAIDLNGQLAALYKLDTDRYISEEERKRAAISKTLNTIKEIGDQMLGLISGIGNAQMIAQKNDITEQQNAAEKKAARDIEIVNASVMSEQDKANKIIVINARLQAQKDQFAQREKQAQQQKARTDKATAIFDIVLNTAIAVSKVFANPLLAIAVGALGAAQLAIAIATPIPKYFKGRSKNDPYTGFATVNEIRREVIERKDGSIEYPSGKNVLTYLEKGDAVHPFGEDFMNSLKGSALRDAGRVATKGGGVSINFSTHAMEGILYKQNSLLQQIADKPTQIIHGTEQGMTQLWRSKAHDVSYFDQNTNW